MSDMHVAASAGMLNGAHGIQASSAMKLIESGAAAAQAGLSSGNAGQGLRTDVMQAQGIGQHLDITA